MYFNKCDACGAFLDPVEHCDCLERKHRKIQTVEDMLVTEKDGQMILKEYMEALRYGNIVRN